MNYKQSIAPVNKRSFAWKKDGETKVISCTSVAALNVMSFRAILFRSCPSPIAYDNLVQRKSDLQHTIHEGGKERAQQRQMVKPWSWNVAEQTMVDRTI